MVVYARAGKIVNQQDLRPHYKLFESLAQISKTSFPFSFVRFVPFVFSCFQKV